MNMEGGTGTGPLLEEANLVDEGEYGGFNDGGNQAGESPDGTLIVVLSSLVAVCGSYAFGIAVGYSSPAESGIVKDLGLTVAEYSVFGSILTIGAMLGAVVSGKAADLLGRRGAMGIAELFCIAGWSSTALSQGPWLLDIGRFLVGCGVGLLSYTVPVYIAEITTKNVRGAFTSLSQLMIGFGQGLTFLIGSLVHWRTLALIGLFPSLLQILVLYFIPESPRWLAKIGQVKEFEASLQRLRGKGANIHQELAHIKEFAENPLLIPENGILDLFRLRYAYPVLVAVGLMVFQQFGGLNGYTFYTTEIFETAGFPSKIGNISAAVVQMMTTILGVLLIDKCGRRPLLMISTSGMCLGCVLTGSSFFLKDINKWLDLTPSIALIGVLVFLSCFYLGMGGIPWIIMSEIFPISIKGAAGSLVNLVSWLGAWIISYTFNFLFEWSSAGTFFLFACICGVGILFMIKLVPETKGRTLEEIQASVTRSGLISRDM